ELLAHVDIAAILHDFGKETRRQDPVFHFYETFLAAYDRTLREGRGVYYTPEPVVSYIVRSVDHLLKQEFGLPEGLADTGTVSVNPPPTASDRMPIQTPVVILDPATGTGTFLHEVVRQIYDENFAGKKAGAWPGYVSRHLLPRLFGFELLMAPYTIAHLKLSLQLREYGYEFGEHDRLRIYLTNTLEEPEGQQQALFADYLAQEANAANDVKRNAPVMVILGNPPYSGTSANNGDWIKYLLHGEASTMLSKTAHMTEQQLADSYFHVDGQPLGERNPKWLNDDYVKFIRFAQWRINRTGKGMLAFISNNGYLDNPTFRGMRESLLQTFDEIYILNLHGNSKKRETNPDGGPDENVFDIQQGVAIGIFIKRDGQPSTQTATVYHADLYGDRDAKYQTLNDSDISATEWVKLAPQSPGYLFIAQDLDLHEEYEQGYKVTSIFGTGSEKADQGKVWGLGVITHNDDLLLDFERGRLEHRFELIEGIATDDEVSAALNLNDGTYWSMKRERDKVRAYPWRNFIKPYLYRPFNNRWICYEPNLMEIGRGGASKHVTGHMLNGSNIALLTTRQTKEPFDAFCTAYASAHKSLSAYDGTYIFPLYLYPDTIPGSKRKPQPSMFETADGGVGGRQANLDARFVREFSAKLGLTYVPDGRGDLQQTFGPEDVFDYMYAVFHAPEYRRRYAEFLKIDFPRLPLTSNVELFRALCGLGRQLVALHLLESKPKSPASYPLNGSDMVEVVRYEPAQGSESGKVWINKQQHFAGVTPAVWEFQIGGYQVAEKWLKDRKGRKLVYEDIEHYRQIIAALGETMRLMAEVDEAIEQHGGWPIK
ncbi:MAG: DNA methyltransferase, partial [Candidatus Chloroheliales bacterium]